MVSLYFSMTLYAYGAPMVTLQTSGAPLRSANVLWRFIADKNNYPKKEVTYLEKYAVRLKTWDRLNKILL